MRITAIVSLYNPSQDNICKSRLIANQVNRIILCDNSKQDNCMAFADIENSLYMSNHGNVGLPRAFNHALKSPDVDWRSDDIVVFFDQDSSIEPGYIEKLFSCYCDIEKVCKACILGPIFFNSSSGKLEVPRIKSRVKDNVFTVSNVITSSMMVRYWLLNEIDYWNERLFLDFADWDLCWRARDYGYPCCITDKVVLQHSVGLGERRVGPLRLRVGQPIREYYQTRDALSLLGERYVPARMRLRLIANVTIRPVMHLLFLDDRVKRISYIIDGFSDYARGFTNEWHE